jgi:hypothetical protein
MFKNVKTGEERLKEFNETYRELCAMMNNVY